MSNGDFLVIWLVLLGVFFWITIPLRRKLKEGIVPVRQIQIPVDDEIEWNETVELLEGAGFDVLSARKRIPISISVGDTEMLESRLFVDYFAQKDGEYYIVKLFKDRKPVEFTGSGLRDAFLSYALVYPEVAGILYVDMEIKKIKKIKFEIESEH